jgi:hypothetical protein
LGDSTGLPAKRFAELDPAPPLDWLEPLSARRFRHHDLRRFGVQPKDEEDGTLEFSFIARPTPYSHAPLMRLVENTNSCSRWDSVMFQLARWLLRHLNEPKLVLWVAAQGGILHPDFDRLVSNEIGNLSRPLQALWRVILSGRVKSRP